MKSNIPAWSLLLILLFSSCSTKTDEPKIELESSDNAAKELNSYIKNTYSETTALEVLFATNRAVKGERSNCSDATYLVGAGEKLNFGVCRVNVPKTHRVGSFEIAPSPRADTHKYFKFLGHQGLENEQGLRTFIEAKKLKDVLVFVHGFNVKFEEAVLRAAQIAYDVKFQGPVILFSWPAGSGSGLLDSAWITRTYKQNQANAQTSIDTFMNFLKYLSSLEIRANILVHSMGHQVVLPALAKLAAESPKKFIGEVILNAPDFGVDEFKLIAPKLKELATRITLYCSYNDNAISASETYNSGRRMGACEMVEGVDVVNVSEIDAPTVGLGHGYYASRPILTDVSQVLLHIEAEKRLFIRKSEPNSTEDFILRP